MLEGFALELLAIVGMGDRNEPARPLGHRLALEVDESIFGDDVHDVRAWRGDDISRRQVEHDAAAALAALVVSRRQANEGLAALRGVGTAHELQLSARAADVAVAVGLGRRLALQVDLGRIVDRDHVVVTHDHVRQVGVLDRQAQQVLIVVDGLVEPPRSERESVDDPAAKQEFLELAAACEEAADKMDDCRASG